MTNSLYLGRVRNQCLHCCKGCVFNRTKRKEQDGFNLQMQQEQEGVKEIDLK